MRGGGLADGAAVGIKWCGTLQMRCGIIQPHEAAIVEMREDCREWAAAAFFARRLCAPGARVEVGEDELVHGIVDSVDFEKGIANFGESGLGCRRRKGSANIAGFRTRTHRGGIVILLRPGRQSFCEPRGRDRDGGVTAARFLTGWLARPGELLTGSKKARGMGGFSYNPPGETWDA